MAYLAASDVTPAGDAYGQPASAQSWLTQTVAQGLLPLGQFLMHAAPGFTGQSAGTLQVWPPSGSTLPPSPPPAPLLPVPELEELEELEEPEELPVLELDELQATRSPKTTAKARVAWRMAGS